MAESKLSSNSSLVFPVSKTIDGICSKITAIYFDLDNTLIPTRAGDSKAIRKLAEVLETQFNFSKDEATLATQTFLKSFRRCPDNSQTSLDSWRSYLWRESLPQRYKHLAERIYTKWLHLRYRYLALTADYVQLLMRLRHAGYALALITNGPSNAQWEKVQKLHVHQYFDCILVSSDLPWEKPHPDIFYAACNFLNVKPQNCAMIGDKLETDIKGGHLAKLGVTFWTPLNNSSTDDLSDVQYRPHKTLNNLMELYKYFPKANAIANTTTGGSLNSTAATTNITPSSSSTDVAAATVTASLVHSSGSSSSSSSSGGGLQLVRRRCSQIYGICDCDKHTNTTKQQNREQRFCFHAMPQHKQPNYRRGNSLPVAMEFTNSENENSCDSMFS